MIYLGADHGGFELKEKIKVWLEEWGEGFEDLGAWEYDKGDDYNVYVRRVAERVQAESNREENWKRQVKGILLCRSGGGMVIGANRYRRVRAVYAENVRAVEHARKDNDANVISLAGDWISEAEAKRVVKAFLTTEFSEEERHERRVSELERMGGK